MKFYVLCVICSIVLLSGCSHTLSQVIKEYGFQRIQPHQNALEPGTLITFEDSGKGLVAITPVCWRHQAFPTLLPPAPTADSELKKYLSDTFSLESEYLEKIQAKFPDVLDIQLRLGNASVSQYSDVKLLDGIALRSQPCQAAVAAREKNGETVHTVLKTLQTDITYEVIGVERSRLKGKLPQKTLERLKTELGGSSVSTFDQTIKGSALHVAFKSDIIGVATIPSAETKPIASAESEGPPRVPQLTNTQRQSIIQNVAILSKVTSDADRLQ